MEKDITKINELEKRLRAEHEEFNRIVASYGSVNDDFVKNKLKYLQAEVDYLNSGVKILNEVMLEDSLKKELGEELPEVVVALEDPKYNSSVDEVVKEAISVEPVIEEKTQEETRLPMKIWVREDSPVDLTEQEVKITPDREEIVQNYLDKVAGNKTEETVEIKKISKPVVEGKKKKASLENRIGLLVMPILAATLIFISVILLASALPESIGNIVKQITMIAAGYSFIGTGLILKKKKKGGAFGQILMAIGVGELFVSLVVCRFVFKSISDLWLIILIFIWSAGLVILKRFSNTLFQLIGEIGVLIAITVGTFYPKFHDGGFKDMLVIAVFYALTTIIFYFVFKLRSKTSNGIIFHSFNIVKLNILTLGICFCGSPVLPYGITGIILATVSLALAADAVFSLKGESLAHKIAGPVLVTAYSFQMFFASMLGTLYIMGRNIKVFDFLNAINLIYDKRAQMIFISAIFIVALILLVEFVWKKHTSKYITEGILALILLGSFACSAPTVKYGFLAMMILFTLLGYVRKNHVLKISALLFYIGYAFLPGEVQFRICVGLIMGTAVLSLIYLTKKQYWFAYKVCVFFSLILYAITISFYVSKTSSQFGLGWIMLLAFTAFLTILTMFSGLSKNKEKESDFVIIPEILNIVITSGSLILSMVICEKGGTLGYIPLLIGFALVIISSLRGFLQNRILCRINSILALSVGIITLTSFDYSAFWFATIAIALGLTLMYIKKERYSFVEKLAYFVLLLIYPGVGVRYFSEALCDLSAVSCFAICTAVDAAFVLLFKFSFLSKNPERDENDFDWITFIAGALVIVAAIAIIPFGEISDGFTLLAFTVMFVLTFVWLINGFLADRNKEKIAVLAVVLITLLTAFVCEGFEIAFGIFTVITAVAFLVLLYIIKESYHMVYKAVMYGEILLGSILVPCLFRDTLADIKYLGVGGVILLAVLAVTLLFKFTALARNANTKENDMSIITFIADIATVVYAQALVWIFNEEGNYVSTAVLALMICIWLIHGFVSKEMKYKIAFIASMFMMALFAWAFVPTMYVVISSVLTILFFVLLYTTENAYSFWQKIAMYSLTMIQAIICPVLYRTTLETLDVLITANVAFLALVIINALFRFTPLSKDPETDESDMSFVTFIVCHVLVAAGLIITFAYEGPADILSGVLTLLLIPMGTVWIWNKEESIPVTVGRYAFVTEYVFIPFILCYAFPSPAYVSSIIGIVLSVGCIVLGFAMKMKGIRIYGLVISMIMIFKLALIDFEKSSLLAYALSFFIAGISCLVISMLYYFVNAAVGEKKKNSAEG